MENEIIKYDSINDLQKFSNTLKDFIVKNQLYSNIKGKNYAHVEGWEFAGASMGIMPMVRKVENIGEGEIKYRAEVELVSVKDEKTVGYGAAICSNKEQSKRGFDEYAVASMAQTRAIGKAYRNSFAFVMKMAGYEPTPAEEIITVEDKEASNETINEIVQSYDKMIAEANTEPKKRVLLRKMKGAFDNNIINEETYSELKNKLGLEEDV